MPVVIEDKNGQRETHINVNEIVVHASKGKLFTAPLQTATAVEKPKHAKSQK